MRHDYALSEDGRRVGGGYGKAPIDQVACEFRLGVLICILAIEVCSPDESTFLMTLSVFKSYPWAGSLT